MSYIGFTNNKTGFTAIKDFSSRDEKQLKSLQRFYDNIFGKGVYSFFLTWGFFTPYTQRIVHPDMNNHSCRSFNND